MTDARPESYLPVSRAIPGAPLRAARRGCASLGRLASRQPALPPTAARRRGLATVAFALPLAASLALGACTAAGPPKPPPPPLQEGLRDVGSPGPVSTASARPPGVATPVLSAPAPAPVSVPGPPPTLPAVVARAIAAAPSPVHTAAAPADAAADALPSARDLANGMIAALDRAKSAHLAARLPSGHFTDLHFVAPDRAALVESDVDGQEYARYVIIGDTGYVHDTRGGTGWRKAVNEGYRRQTQIFRPMQIALATGEPRALDSGAEVESALDSGKPVLRALFEYGSSEDLQELGLMRSAGNLLEILVDPTSWLPVRTREQTETGTPEKAVTEVTFLEFDQPVVVDPPIS